MFPGLGTNASLYATAMYLFILGIVNLDIGVTRRVTDAPVTSYGTSGTRRVLLVISHSFPAKWHPVQTLDPVHSFAVLGVAAHSEGNEVGVGAAQVPHGQMRYPNKMTKARGSQKDSSR